MRAVVQRVLAASVVVEGAIVAEIGQGLLVLLGVAAVDSEDDAVRIAERIAHMRIFPDQAGRFDRSVTDVGGEVLVVSQFTLYGDTRRGRRPSFSTAASGAEANHLYESAIAHLRQLGLRVQCGRFGAHMRVSSVNDGPVTLIVDQP